MWLLLSVWKITLQILTKNEKKDNKQIVIELIRMIRKETTERKQVLLKSLFSFKQKVLLFILLDGKQY